MSTSDTSTSPFSTTWAFMRALVELTKPRIVALCTIMAGAGMFLAPHRLSLSHALWVLFFSALSVASANSFNMILERETDKLMERTKHRPLPRGSLTAQSALIFGIASGIVSTVGLWWSSNLLTTLLSLVAIVTYALLYTPLKQRTPWSLYIGAIPGAMPPLMGWSASTGSIELPGIVLFAIVGFWQIPHFIAIALYRRSDYERAGIKAMPITLGDTVATQHALIFSALLIPTSALFFFLGIAGWVYLAIALTAGVWFLVEGIVGLWWHPSFAGARRFFFISLIYLPLIAGALVTNALL